MCSLRLFTPTSKYFYTDISVISVTFRNSGLDIVIEWGSGRNWHSCNEVLGQLFGDQQMMCQRPRLFIAVHHSGTITVGYCRSSFHSSPTLSTRSPQFVTKTPSHTSTLWTAPPPLPPPTLILTSSLFSSQSFLLLLSHQYGT